MSIQPPSEIRLQGRSGEVQFCWPSGEVTCKRFEALRLACRCAHCTLARRRDEPVTDAAHVDVVDIVPFGVSGVRFVFSDGHEQGIYPWRYLWDISVRDASRSINDENTARLESGR
ncbi:MULTISPECIES: gamma-butyrobetaine hydroxylase-like domain-containing protein [unclassified Thioalkalivibrio]|uniref:gamma-butyrobetaine hydroxylase-like domain-containing protein n=1 Tax=unclassified Thioalkalivibrio TaxID=2621013 RepID=UPI00036EF065|nr:MULTISPECIES: gamma-butyrobetaine hydroxylase-like domain-containing protein [unclassified Thioalkalivibrio]